MPLSPVQIEQLLAALGRYHHPCYVWNHSQTVLLGNMVEVEAFICEHLHSQNNNDITTGLASIVRWGWGDSALGPIRAQIAEDAITLDPNHIARFMDYRAQFPHGDIHAFANLNTPQLGRMAYGTKVLAFLHPRTRAVLDKKIAGVLNSSDFLPFFGLIPSGNAIAITGRTACLYNAWCGCCRNGAVQMGCACRAVDFERAIFQMIREEEGHQGHRQMAIDCVNAVIA